MKYYKHTLLIHNESHRFSTLPEIPRSVHEAPRLAPAGRSMPLLLRSAGATALAAARRESSELRTLLAVGNCARRLATDLDITIEDN